MSMVAQTNEVKQGSYQLFDALTDDEYKALKDDIRERGVLVPVELDENGIILDGHHRVRAWNELCAEGVEITPYVRNYRYDLTEEQKRSHVRALNILRRHLNQDQKRRAVAEQLKETPERSNRQIAEELGVSHHTVGAVRDELDSTGQIAQFDKTVGKDGKSRPAKAKTPGIITTSNTSPFPKILGPVRDLAAKIDVINPEKLDILARLHESAQNPDSNKTFYEISRTGGFHYGNALEKWCDFSTASISDINRALKSLSDTHKGIARDARNALGDNAADAAHDAGDADVTTQYRTGDVLTLGKHLLICGDNASESVRRILDTEHIALAFCDIPYNATDEAWDGAFTWSHDFLTDYADIVAVTPGISSIWDFMRRTEMRYRWSLSAYISNGMTRGALGFGNWIYTALFSDLPSIHRNAQDVFTIEISSQDANELGAKRQKPPRYLAWLFQLLTTQNDTILDAFGGSGTSVIVAHQLQRRCICVEIDETTFSGMVARLENALHMKAVLRGTTE